MLTVYIYKSIGCCSCEIGCHMGICSAESLGNQLVCVHQKVNFQHWHILFDYIVVIGNRWLAVQGFTKLYCTSHQTSFTCWHWGWSLSWWMSPEQ